MRRALLDVNVLPALLDADHVDHDRAHDGCLVTLDRSVSLAAAPGATQENLTVR